jgi:hypothetical protein
MTKSQLAGFPEERFIGRSQSLSDVASEIEILALPGVESLRSIL